MTEAGRVGGGINARPMLASLDIGSSAASETRLVHQMFIAIVFETSFRRLVGPMGKSLMIWWKQPTSSGHPGKDGGRTIGLLA